MPIVARDLDVSERKFVLEFKTSKLMNGATTIPTGATLLVGIVRFPAEIQSIVIYGQGNSGVPAMVPDILRFIPGAGFTAITGLVAGSTILLPNYGTSGAVSASLVAAGSTLLQCLAGDVIQVRVAGTNTATTDLDIMVVVKKLQDIVSFNGNAG